MESRLKHEPVKRERCVLTSFYRGPFGGLNRKDTNRFSSDCKDMAESVKSLEVSFRDHQCKIPSPPFSFKTSTLRRLSTQD